MDDVRLNGPVNSIADLESLLFARDPESLQFTNHLRDWLSFVRDGELYLLERDDEILYKNDLGSFISYSINFLSTGKPFSPLNILLGNEQYTTAGTSMFTLRDQIIYGFEYGVKFTDKLQKLCHSTSNFLTIHCGFLSQAELEKIIEKVGGYSQPSHVNPLPK